MKALRELLQYQQAKDGSGKLERRCVLSLSNFTISHVLMHCFDCRSMDSSLLDDGMIVGETFCTQYRLDKAKARILAMDTTITPVMSFAEVRVFDACLVFCICCYSVCIAGHVQSDAYTRCSKGCKQTFGQQYSNPFEGAVFDKKCVFMCSLCYAVLSVHYYISFADVPPPAPALRLRGFMAPTSKKKINITGISPWARMGFLETSRRPDFRCRRLVHV